MIKVVSFLGGIGNQMFCYAFYYVLKKRSFLSYVDIDIYPTSVHHNGFELNKIFRSIKLKKWKFYRRLNKIHSILFTKFLFKKIYENSSGHYQKLKCEIAPFIVYHGFWQSELYFLNYKNDIKRLFQFDRSKLTRKNEHLLCHIINNESVSIHIRRGDYLFNEELGMVCSISYYRKALEIIYDKLNNAIFYVFSDDPSWVKINFDFFEYHLIDWNTKNDSWQDLFLMSQCKHNIIANSSFSWWAAWLNNNKDKIVISPKKWYKTKIAPDIVPMSWIKI